MSKSAQAASKRSAVSSVISSVVLGGIFLLTVLAPTIFHEPPAHLSHLLAWLGVALLAVIFILVTLRRGKISLKLPPLTWPLVALIITILLSACLNYSHTLITTLVGQGGLIIAGALLAIFGSQLLKSKNQKVIINLLLCLGGLIAVFALYAAIYNLMTGAAPSWIATYYPNLAFTSLAVIIPALAGLLALYMRKGKLARAQLIVIPILALGLAAALTLTSQLGNFRPTPANSLTVIKNSLTLSPEIVDGSQNLIKNTFFDNLLALLLGRGSENYSFIYNRYYQSNYFSTAWNLPFTLLPTIGGLGTLAWFWLLILVWREVFNTKNQSRAISFALAVSLTTQLFVPLDAVAIVLQSILFTFCVQNQNPTFSSPKNNRSKLFFKALRCILIFLVLFGIFMAFIRVAISYLAYFYHEKNLQQVTDLTRSNVMDYYDASQKAVELAPNIDIFNQFAGVANLELALRNPDSDTYLTQAIDYATRATELGPLRTSNWLVLSYLYQDLAVLGVDAANSADWAIRAAANAVLTDPTNPNHYLLLGNLYLQQAAGNQALPFFTQALELLDENDPDYYVNQREIENLIKQIET